MGGPRPASEIIAAPAPRRVEESPSDRGRLQGVLLAALGLVLPFLLLSSVEAVVWLLGVGVPAAIVGLLVALATAGRRLRARGEGLELMRVIQGPLRTTILIRGEHRGHPVRVYRDRVEVGVSSPEVRRLDRSALRGLSQTESVSDVVREAARALVAADVRAVEVELDRVIICGGRARAAALAPHAVELVLASSLIRFSPSRRVAERGCPYCKQTVGSVLAAPAVRCPGCDALHHTECWREHGGCSVFRCRRAPPANRVRVEEPPPATEALETPLAIRARERAQM